MSDINYWSDEYKREIDQYSAGLNYYVSIVNNVKLNQQLVTQAQNDCETKGNRVKEVKKSYGLELRLVKDKAVKSDHEQRIKGLDEQFAQLQTQFKEAKSSLQKKQLLQGGAPTNPFDTTGKTNDDLLSGASVLQDKTEESLARTRALIDQSKEVGTATIEQLRAQRDQIKGINEDIDKMESHIERAEKLVLDYTKRMASDKIIQAFAVVNGCIMVVLIAYVLITGKTLSKSNGNSIIGVVFGANTYRPTAIPTHAPINGSSFPSVTPSFRPSIIPTFQPTDIPSIQPTDSPTCQPTVIPTTLPTIDSSFTPSLIPSAFPSFCPSSSPTYLPSITPSSSPSETPSNKPSSNPSQNPSINPSPSPSSTPSHGPTVNPSPEPSESPTNKPSSSPSIIPSNVPTASPSAEVTDQPSSAPT